MNIRPLKIFLVILAVIFLSSCAVFVRDDHHHRRDRYHSSVERSLQHKVQITAQNSGDSIGYEQVSR